MKTTRRLSHFEPTELTPLDSTQLVEGDGCAKVWGGCITNGDQPIKHTTIRYVTGSRSRTGMRMYR
jgi:hypothetical protein